MYEESKCHHAGMLPRSDVMLLSNVSADKLHAQSILAVGIYNRPFPNYL